MTFDQHLRGRFKYYDVLDTFLILDTILGKTRSYAGEHFLYRSTFAEVDYGDTTLSPETSTDRDDFIFGSAVYTPYRILVEFLAQPESTFTAFVKESGEQGLAKIGFVAAGDRRVEIEVDTKKFNVISIALTTPDDLYGDVRDEFTYSDYDDFGVSDGDATFTFAGHITERKHDIIVNEVRIAHDSTPIDNVSSILPRLSKGYALHEETPKPTEIMTATKFNSEIYFLEFRQAESRVLLVNFKEYLLVAEAPLTPENGELILKKAHDLFPNKPVRYFIFGHHHPWYLGGVRSMVHDGVTILSQPMDTAYVRQLVTFPHHLRPDMLEKEPHPLILETFDSTKTITDGDLEMQVLSLGKMSKHTDDYLMYYFPKYKLLFEDDLSGSVVGKPTRPADEREKGLYEGIKKYNLDVETIAQSWPNSPDYETIFSSSKLAEKVGMMAK
jgi:hypothetical protein